MFGKTRQQLGNAISVPAKNASLMSLLAVVISIVALLVATALAVHH
jgi:hypothetical protein